MLPRQHIVPGKPHGDPPPSIIGGPESGIVVVHAPPTHA
jgi:hypothetical protein